MMTKKDIGMFTMKCQKKTKGVTEIFSYKKKIVSEDNDVPDLLYDPDP